MSDMDIEGNAEPAQGVPKSEGLLTQEHVNALIGKEKAEAAEKARREVEAEYEAKLAASNQAQSQPAQVGMTEEDIAAATQKQVEAALKKQREDAEREEYQRGMDALAQSYQEKLNQGKELFEDFDSVVGDFDPNELPHLAFLLAEVENMPEVLYDLGSNSSKLANLAVLSQSSPKLARKQLKELSQSIEQNKQAVANNVAVQPPLSRPQKSTVGSDNGRTTIRDLKQADWLRG